MAVQNFKNRYNFSGIHYWEIFWIADYEFKVRIWKFKM